MVKENYMFKKPLNIIGYENLDCPIFDLYRKYG